MKRNSELFEFIDRIFYNIYSYLPDEHVADFVLKYTNLLFWRYSPNKEKVGWTIYPPDHEDLKFISVLHSLELKSHPFLPSQFFSGHLEILNQENENENHTQELRLNLIFYYKADALKVIDLIDTKMTALECKKKEQTIYKCLMVEYSSESSEILSGISYKLGPDIFEHKRYRLIIYPRANRIHFPLK